MFSNFLWKYMSDVFRYGLKISEIGVTNHLIFDITNFYQGFNKSCEVYSWHAPNEKVRGADIDLFIQNKNGTYQFYMLQAKIMTYRGNYMDIKKWSPNAQFIKLINAANQESALPLYLFYNGSTNNSYKGNQDFGISIVEAVKIRNYRLNQHKTKYINTKITLDFDTLFNLNMQPFHNLFCNGIKGVSLPSSIKEDDIYLGKPYHKISIINVEKDDLHDKDFENFENSGIIKDKNLAPYRIIIKNEK